MCGHFQSVKKFFFVCNKKFKFSVHHFQAVSSSNSMDSWGRNWFRWNRTNPEEGSWPFTTSNMIVYICYITTLILFGFQRSGAPLRQNPDPAGKGEPVSCTPNGQRRNGVDSWTFLLSSVGVPGRSRASGSQLNLGDVIRMGCSDTLEEPTSNSCNPL